MTTAPAKDFVSIGILASQLGVPVRAIERAAEQLDVEPSLTLNNVAHFDRDQVQRLSKQLNGGK